MTRRLELEMHRRTLGEIRGIMNSMKTLAYMEARRLAPFLKAQQAAVAGIEAVAADFLGAHPETLTGLQQATPVYLVIGSEQGFCGDFNETLLAHLTLTLDSSTGPSPVLLTIGRRLHPLMAGDPRVAAQLDGASMVEEIEPVLSAIVDRLAEVGAGHESRRLYGLYHGGEDGGVIARQLLPPFRGLQPARAFPYPPMMNLRPEGFLLELTEHYLYAVLHEMIYTSLMAESTLRVQHLEGAVRHLDEETSRLQRRSNALRQEEIIEEIEVILLSAASVGEGGIPGAPGR